MSNLDLFQSAAWEATPLGPVGGWPAEMRSVVAAALNSAFPICTVWGEECIQIYNDAYNPIYGHKHPHSFGAPVQASWAEIWPFLQRALQQVRDTRKAVWFERTLLPLARQGKPEECYFDFSYSPVLSLSGEVIGMMSAAVDRTAETVERRRQPCDAWALHFDTAADEPAILAQALQERLSANTMDACDAAMHVFAGDGRARLVWQRRPADALWPRIVSPVMGAGQPVRVPLEPAPAGGRAPYAHLLPLTDSDGSSLCVITLVPDALVPEASHRGFCERLSLRLHAALRQARARRDELQLLRKEVSGRERLYQALFETMEDAAFYTAVGPGPSDPDVILAANRKAEELSGYGAAELVGMRRDALYFPGDPALQAAVAQRSSSGSFLGELTLRRKDGSALPVELSTRLVQVGPEDYRSVCIVRDASHHQAQARAAADRARLEALTQLTGGIAHDFNNFLTVILGNLDALEGALSAASPERNLVASAILGAERAASLTHQLLTYAKRKNLQTSPVHWKEYLEEVAGLLASTLGERNRIVVDVAEDTPRCELDVAQLTSALLNFAANARDAMPQGGTFTVQVTTVCLDQPQAGAEGRALAAGRYVQLRVADTGNGIPPDSLARVFEPFFTTKPPEAGSGLGLAMVRAFVDQCRGDVRVASSSQAGTEFRLLFPCALP